MDSNQPPPMNRQERTPPPEQSTPHEKLDLNKPCKITGVNFEGVYKTRPNLLAKIVADIFPAKTLSDFLLRSVEVGERLEALEAFNSVEIKIKPVRENDDGDYRVTFVVEECGSVKARVATQTAVDSHSTHLNLKLVLPNLNGISDSIELNSRIDNRKYSGEFRYSVPLAPWRHLWAPKYSLSCSQSQWDFLPSGFDQEDKSLVNQIEFFSLPHVQHAITFENIWRYIRSSSLKTPIEIREQSGHSVKSSIKHTVTWDNRNGGNFQSQGILAKLSNEFAPSLVNGGAKFTRHELNLQLNKLILPRYDLICRVNLSAGTLFRPHKINICDRFFAGGPLTLRGFKFQGLEPNVKGYPLGDLSYLSAGVHLYPILPYTTPETKINENIRPHLFINTGTIGNINDIRRIAGRDDIKREAIRFRDSLRFSCGFGLVMYFMGLRLEVNYCLPLVFKEKDLSLRGVQWGFGITYS